MAKRIIIAFILGFLVLGLVWLIIWDINHVCIRYRTVTKDELRYVYEGPFAGEKPHYIIIYYDDDGIKESKINLIEIGSKECIDYGKNHR